MYPVTKAVADQFKTNARQNLSLLVNPVVGESFELTSADILSAGLNINRYSATGDSVALGVCSAADLSLRVENGDGRFNDVVFEGAQIYASVGVEDGNNTQWVPLGYFTVDNAPRRLAVISITALDGMVQFDKLANRSALSLPNSVKNIVLACCNECNITIDTDLDSLPNSDFVAQSVGDAEDLTYRTILQWCCQLMGVCGFMDWQGHLELSWYKKDGIPETVSGAVATFESVTEVPVSQLLVDISPVQSFNGYDSPWVGGAGKNLSPLKDATTTSSGNLSLTQNGKYGENYVAGTTYTVSFDLLELNAGNFELRYNNSNVHRWNAGAFTTLGRKSYTYTPTADGYFNFWSANSAFTASAKVLDNVQVEVGSTATDYVPYENICPITGQTEVNVSRTGKNLVNQAGVTGTSGSSEVPVYVPEGTYYWFQVTGNMSHNTYYRYSLDGITFKNVPTTDDGYAVATYSSGSYNRPKNKVTVHQPCWIGCRIGKNTNTGNYPIDVMLTTDDTGYSSFPTSGSTLAYGDVYTPYEGGAVSVTMGQDVYGGTLDVVSGVLTVTHKAVDLGNLSWSYQTDNTRFIAPVTGKAYGWDNVICSAYSLPASSEASAFMNGNVKGFTTNQNVTIKNTNYTDADLFKTSVTGQTLVYELGNYQTYQLTPTQVELLKGINNIWADGNSTISVTFPAVTEITPADRYNSDIFENAVTITGVSVKGKENQAVVGSEDYALAIDSNSLITDDDVETIANGLSGLIGFSYHPFSASVLPMPYLYPLDMVAVQYKDEWYDCAITEINFTSTAPTQLKGTGESAQSRSYARINPLTNRERAIIENLKDEMNTTLNKAVNNIIDFNNIISNALGLYHTNVADGSGGFIRYLHDAPDLESSTYIVTETAQGFAWTTNGWNGGSPIWQYGVTSGGYALFKWLSAEGIDVTRASSDYRAEVTPEHFNIYYKNDLIITIDATDRAIQTPRMVIPYSSTSNNSLRVGQLVWLPTTNGANAVVLGS